MKTLHFAKPLLAVFFVVAAIPAIAQSVPGYYRVEFIKTKPGKATEYQDFLKKNLPTITKASISAGKQMGWGIGRVFTPTGTSVDHDFVGLYAYERWEQMEPLSSPADYTLAAMKSLGFASMAAYAAKRDPMRDIVRTEIWKRQAGTTASADNAPKAGEYVVISFLKTLPGKSASYDEIWKTYSLPLQEERVKAGKLKSYSMYVVPGAGELGSRYDHVSMARYGAFKDMDNSDGASALSEVADKVHAGKDWRQMRRDMTSMRSTYRSEIIRIAETVR